MIPRPGHHPGLREDARRRRGGGRHGGGAGQERALQKIAAPGVVGLIVRKGIRLIGHV